MKLCSTSINATQAQTTTTVSSRYLSLNTQLVDLILVLDSVEGVQREEQQVCLVKYKVLCIFVCTRQEHSNKWPYKKDQVILQRVEHMQNLTKIQPSSK